MYVCTKGSCLKNHSHSRLRYLCTLGFPLMAAILTGLVPGLIRILVEVVVVLLSRPLCRLLWFRLPLSNENETSDSVPVFDKIKKKEKKNDGGGIKSKSKTN